MGNAVCVNVRLGGNTFDSHSQIKTEAEQGFVKDRTAEKTLMNWFTFILSPHQKKHISCTASVQYSLPAFGNHASAFTFKLKAAMRQL